MNETDSVGMVDVRKNGLGMRRRKDEIGIACMLLLFLFLRARVKELQNNIPYTILVLYQEVPYTIIFHLLSNPHISFLHSLP